MSTTDTSGPAFPSMRDMRHCPDFDHEPGMSKREAFAMAAMQGMLANPANQGATADQIAAVAWHYADKMLQWRAN